MASGHWLNQKTNPAGSGPCLKRNGNRYTCFIGPKPLFNLDFYFNRVHNSKHNIKSEVT